MSAKRHVSAARRRLTEIAARRLEEIGWSLNERTLNASRFAGTCTLVAYYEKSRRHEVGLVNPYSKSRSVSMMGFITIAVSMDEAYKTVAQAQTILADLHRWIVEDPLEAMAVLGMSEDADAV
jgi:3-methyladenine DNA glycosylase/8-oxoguanine DNA glycosylase